MKSSVAEIYVIVDDDVDASVQPLDPAVHAGQEPDLTTNTNSPDVPPIDPQGVSKIGHRRGRRQVIKKKMLKDEEGYLGEPLQRKTKLTGHKSNSYFQLRRKNHYGSLFQRKSLLFQKER